MELIKIIHSNDDVEVIRVLSNNRKVHYSREFILNLEVDIDNLEVTAKYLNYKGELQSDFNGIITFKLGVESVEINAIEGIAICSLNVVDSGKYEIIASSPMATNGRLILNG